jgi:hypothetical protein
MRLSEWMAVAQVNHKQLADMAGIPLSTAYSWVNGKISAEGVASVQAITANRVTALDFFPSRAGDGGTTEAREAQARVFRARI